MSAITTAAQRFVRRTCLQTNEYRTNFRQIDCDVIAALDYVRAARALGQTNRKIMMRHILPNSITPVVTLIPFELAAAIGALTSLDFLGLGVPPTTPSLGELLSQGKENLYAWWISLSTFSVLMLTLLLLILIGDALRDALDPRKVLKDDQP